jgi:hypothetical protein
MVYGVSCAGNEMNTCGEGAYGAWRMVYGVWRLVYGVWCMR